MYFPNAFRKVFTPAVSAGSISVAANGTNTSALTAGQIGVFDAKTYTALTAANIGSKAFILAQGSLYASDKIGPFHGGYKESIKSKVINPRYVSRFFKVGAKSPVNQILTVGVSGVKQDSTYRLRVDIKGSPALRLLSRNLYYTADAYTGCGDKAVSADPTLVAVEWAKEINAHPYLPEFVAAKVFRQKQAAVAATRTAGSAVISVADADRTKFAVGDKVVGTGIAGASYVTAIGATGSASAGNTAITLSKTVTAAGSGNVQVLEDVNLTTFTAATSGVENIVAQMELRVAYSDTRFGNTTFTVTDFYELEPLQVFASFTDESGDACSVNTFAVSEIQAPVVVSGLGETVLRDLILSMRYEQIPFHDSASVDHLRMREVEGHPALSTISRTALYDQVCLLHNVPRLNNPTSTFDNDQYLLVLHVPTGTATTALTDIIGAGLTAAGTGVALETF